ncbi:hypothetical protein [Actinophytocola sediminis]
MTTWVRVPKYARELALGDRLEDCPDGCQCSGGGWQIQHLRIDHRHHDGQPRSPDGGRVVVEPCTDLPAREWRLGDVVTTLVDVDRIAPIRSHAARITSSELRVQGWYRRYTRHDVACSCGWHADESPIVVMGAAFARQLWMEHRASAISALLAPQRESWGLPSSAAVLRETDPGARWPHRVAMRRAR